MYGTRKGEWRCIYSLSSGGHGLVSVSASNWSIDMHTNPVTSPMLLPQLFERSLYNVMTQSFGKPFIPPSTLDSTLATPPCSALHVSCRRSPSFPRTFRNFVRRFWNHVYERWMKHWWLFIIDLSFLSYKSNKSNVGMYQPNYLYLYWIHQSKIFS